MTAFNHLGHCVSDVGRARRFYEELLGFRHWWGMEVGDESAGLLRLEPPMGMRADYLVRDGLVLELLHFAAIPADPPERVMSEPGLTHVSLSVDDLEETLAKVPAYGGEVLEDTRLPVACMIKDPDGQLVELLTMDFHNRRPDRPLDDDDPAAVVGRYFDHMSRGDIGVVDLFHEDAVLQGGGGEHRGREAIESFYRRALDQSPAPRLVSPLVTDGNRVIAEIEVELPDRTLEVVDLFDVEDGRISQLRLYLANR